MISSFHLNPHFVPLPRPGSTYENAMSEKFDLSELAIDINNVSTQIKALDKLGVSFNGKNLIIEFYEVGYPYEDPKGDRSKLLSESEQDFFTVRLVMDDINFRGPLDLTIDLNPFVQDGVNFLGQVCIVVKNGLSRSIPLIGQGTVALEGRSNDSHAGFCTGASCASFQQRAAIVMAAARASNVRNESYELLQNKLRKLNDKYHGRNDILEYTFLCANEDNVESYLEFMKRRYSSSDDIPPMLANYSIGLGPVDEYYTQLTRKISPEEVTKEKTVWTSNAKIRSRRSNGIGPMSDDSDVHRGSGSKKIIIVICSVLVIAIGIGIAVLSKVK